MSFIGLKGGLKGTGGDLCILKQASLIAFFLLGIKSVNRWQRSKHKRLLQLLQN